MLEPGDLVEWATVIPGKTAADADPFAQVDALTYRKCYGQVISSGSGGKNYYWVRDMYGSKLLLYAGRLTKLRVR